MKKLLIASMAAALTAGAWASETVTYTKTTQGFEDGASEAETYSLEDGMWNAPTDTSGITVKTYDDGAAYTYGTPAANTAAFGGPGSKYLNLETDSGAVLRRNFAETAGAVTVDANNSYVVDTLVKFTATDEAPTVDTANGDKFILWLRSTEGSDNTTTYSLMATCGTIDEMGSVSGSADIALNADVTAEQWARVSVKTIKFFNDDNAYGTLGFVVYVDGVAVSASQAEYAALFGTVNVDDELTTQGADYYSKQMVFPCLITGDSSTADTVSLTSVGFEGTGAIDDLLIAKTGDGAPSFTDWTAPVVSYTVSFQAVGLADGVTWTKDSETITSGETLAQPDAPVVTGYTFKGWFSDEVCEKEITFPLTIEATQTIYAKFEQEAKADPVAPGDTVSGDTEDAAKQALENAGIAYPFDTMTDTQKANYEAMFTATATQNAEGTGWTAEWTLTAAAVETLETSANNALATTLSGVLDSTATSVSLTTDVQPGFYYSVLSADTVDATTYEAAGWTMAEGDSVTLTLPTKDATATQGFYKVGVSAVNPTAAE